MSSQSEEEKKSLIIAAAVALIALASMKFSGKKRGTGSGAIASLEPARGRYAENPSEIPGRGWKDIAIRVYKSISEDRVLAEAAGITYYTLLAIFPAIAALVSIYGMVADPAQIASTLDNVKGILPGGAIDVVREQLTRVTAQPSSTLGLGAIVGLLIALWSANSGIKALFDALNVVYDEKEKRGFFALNVTSLAFTIGAITFLIVAIAAVAGLPIALKHLPLHRVVEWVIEIMRWPVLLAAVVLALAFFYRYGPSRDRAKWKWVTWGSAIAGVLWLGASALFSWYAANFGNYNETYGSLGAVIGFMTWLWISAIVILLGGEINAEIEHQTLRDSTVGHRAPLGTRGAKMADTVGAAQAS
jgi:membrane protein